MKPIACVSIFFVSICFICLAMVSTTEPVKLVNVGVILDIADEWIGKLCLSCIQMAHSDFYATHGYYNTRLVLNLRDSKSDLIIAASAGNKCKRPKDMLHDVQRDLSKFSTTTGHHTVEIT
ncbi:hypothetical protein L6164_023510 [Bauhinia variegata]|uniref:Uncharacterized protein n=1 Tax=Bauhinia variegata TaxID=167791 RepID=A0ACB9MJ20_BAUVA|nr:hypothetical protein L6164_023510 [Bauhinia variegata]